MQMEERRQVRTKVINHWKWVLSQLTQVILPRSVEMLNGCVHEWIGSMTEWANDGWMNKLMHEWGSERLSWLMTEQVSEGVSQGMEEEVKDDWAKGWGKAGIVKGVCILWLTPITNMFVTMVLKEIIKKRKKMRAGVIAQWGKKSGQFWMEGCRKGSIEVSTKGPIVPSPFLIMWFQLQGPWKKAK